MKIQPDDILKMSIENMKIGDADVFAVRHMNCLINDFGAKTVGDLVKITKNELLEHPNDVCYENNRNTCRADKLQHKPKSLAKYTLRS